MSLELKPLAVDKVTLEMQTMYQRMHFASSQVRCANIEFYTMLDRFLNSFCAMVETWHCYPEYALPNGGNAIQFLVVKNPPLTPYKGDVE